MSYAVVGSAITSGPSPTRTSISLEALSGPWNDYNALSHQENSLVKSSPPSLNLYVEIKDPNILTIEYLQLHIGIGKRYLERGINWWLFTQRRKAAKDIGKLTWNARRSAGTTFVISIMLMFFPIQEKLP